MTAGLKVEELDKIRGVDEVAVDAHGQAKGGVDEEGLGLGSGTRHVSWRIESGRCGRTYAEEVPAVGYRRWEILPGLALE